MTLGTKPNQFSQSMLLDAVHDCSCTGREMA